MAISNRLFGGRRALLAEIEFALPSLGKSGLLLDVGTGLADIPRAAAELARRRGVHLATVGVDMAEELARASLGLVDGAVCADARRLPFADASVDIVTCSQLLHHFSEAEGSLLVRELHRVARRRVVIADLQRSWLAAGGFWLASWPLLFHPVTRHDGTLSVLRGFTASELSALVVQAVGTAPELRAWGGWRVTASWSPLPLARAT